MFKGFSPDLQTAADLLGKLQRDHKRIQSDPTNADAAFDFFVTAEHLPEWFFGGDAKRAREFRVSHLLLSVVSHLASGAKHFRATREEHKSVREVNLKPGAFARGVFSAAFDVGSLVVDLDGPAARELGEHVDVRVLAQQIVTFWAEEIEKDRPTDS